MFGIIVSVREGVEYHFADLVRKEANPPLHIPLRTVCKHGHGKTFKKN